MEIEGLALCIGKYGRIRKQALSGGRVVLGEGLTAGLCDGRSWLQDQEAQGRGRNGGLSTSHSAGRNKSPVAEDRPVEVDVFVQDQGNEGVSFKGSLGKWVNSAARPCTRSLPMTGQRGPEGDSAWLVQQRRPALTVTVCLLASLITHKEATAVILVYSPVSHGCQS